MKKIIIFLLLLPVVLGDVQIFQVLYDPIGTESGGEFIQLYNDDLYPADISGWQIQTSSSVKDVEFPAGTVIPGEGYYLVADANWGEKKDDASWPNASLEEIITMKNSDSGIALLFDGLILDAVGWGNAPDGLFVGEAAVDVDAGKSLLRIQDTDNNADDFISSVPVFSFQKNSQELTISLDVISNNVSVGEIIVPDVDVTKEGIQILPRAGAVKHVPVSFSLDSSLPVIVSASFNGISFAMNASNNGFVGLFPINYTLSSGIYELLISIENDFSVEERLVLVEVLPLVAFSLDNHLLHLGNATPGSTLHYSDIVLQNVGNAILDLGVMTNGLFSEEDEILPSFLSIAFGDQFISLEEELVVEVGLQPGGFLPIDFKVQVPEVSEGRYNGKIILFGVAG